MQTGQFKQAACPISGGKVSEEQFCELDGVKVFMCCGKCKAKVDAATTDEEKRELVFANASFDKAFAMKATYDLTDVKCFICLLYTSPSPRDKRQSRMPSSA